MDRSAQTPTITPTAVERQQEVYKDMMEGVRLARDIAADGDWTQLRQVHETLMNLVMDAVRYEHLAQFKADAR